MFATSTLLLLASHIPGPQNGSLLLQKATKLSFHVTQFDTNSENQLSQAAASNHSDVLVFMLRLSEGRSVEAWEPSSYSLRNTELHINILHKNYGGHQQRKV